MGKRDFITVNISNENTQVQVLKPGMTGDTVVASAHSRYLLEKGWKGSMLVAMSTQDWQAQTDATTLVVTLAGNIDITLKQS